MRPVALSDEIAVGEMPSADEITILAKAGFRSLLSVQPDGEVARLMSATETGKGAAASSMSFAHVAIASRRVPDDQVAAFAHAMMTLPRPIYACCYSGARAAAAWALAVAPDMPPADVAAACDTAGYDMTTLLPVLERRHAKQPELAQTDPPTETPPSAPETAAPSTPTAGLSPHPSTPEPTMTAQASTTAPAAVTAAEKIIFPRAAGAGGFAVSG